MHTEPQITQLEFNAVQENIKTEIDRLRHFQGQIKPEIYSEFSRLVGRIEKLEKIVAELTTD
jgi:hypothetical protein